MLAQPPGQYEIQYQTLSHDEGVMLDDITDDNAIEEKLGNNTVLARAPEDGRLVSRPTRFESSVTRSLFRF
jgi:hypothetical protein